MENISPEQAAGQVLAACLEGRPWRPEALDQLLTPEGNRALFSVVVEGLADRFEPRLCDAYVALFAEVIARTIPGVSAADLIARYDRVRKPFPVATSPRKVYVLSRVTLGADVAVTSIVLDAAKRRFPEAAIYFAGPAKNWELFAADPALRHLPVTYGRAGSLADRLSVWPVLRQALDNPDSLVIDPDSRLTQLGLLPVCLEERYRFFESRAYGGESGASLPQLTKAWVREVLGVTGAEPFIAPEPARGDAFAITVSLGVGENEAKRVADPFEEKLLALLSDRAETILVDRGAGGEEAARVERAAVNSGGRIQLWDGSFAGFAAQISRSRLYLGYDSAGGHVAAACGVPMVSIFGGFASERMFQRWRPYGRRPIEVIRASGPTATLERVKEALQRLS